VGVIALPDIDGLWQGRADRSRKSWREAEKGWKWFGVAARRTTATR